MFLSLQGTSYQNGKKIGLHSKRILISRAQQISRIRRTKKIPSRIINARIKDFTGLLSRITPHWLEEIKGQADASGVSADDLLFLNCLPDDFFSDMPKGFSLDVRDNCTSFVSVDKKQSLLFKIRDEKNFPQAFFVLGAKGFFRSQAGRDIGNMGFAHFFNEKALGGVFNVGSAVKHHEDKPLLNPLHLMRYISERAGSLKEIPEMMEKLIEKGSVCGVRSNTGAIFLFANPEGGLLVECDSQHYATRFISKSRWVVANYFTTPEAKKWMAKPPGKSSIRRKRLMYLLSKNSSNLSPGCIFGISRDRKNMPYSLCRDNRKDSVMTISVQYQVIKRKSPSESVNYICCGNPLHSVYIPVPLQYKHTYIPLLDGSFYRAAEKSYLKDMSREKAAPEIEKWEINMLKSKRPEAGFFERAYEVVKELAARKS